MGAEIIKCLTMGQHSDFPESVTTTDSTALTWAHISGSDSPRRVQSADT